ncbi:XylR family transcriptional regulator [Algibacillus agarilyticus]|uniref:XylR family transcriptional regulator n=1 Tax=Algibacillus agarilyticus TaxID=2234133 RepID=UPI000DD0A3CE|nr:DNA-binding transcriptional regulator [Algibacillus agarilyticus]
MFDKKHSITLLFNANKVYDRKVIEGIGHYLQSTKVDWDLFLEEDFLCRIDDIAEWGGDGIIADFDDPLIREALHNSQVPVVGIGSSFSSEAQFPNVPYVATDNLAVIKTAYDHIKQKGLDSFAYYGLPESESKLWASEREKAMLSVCAQDGYECTVFRGQETQADTWKESMSVLGDWLDSLPKPIGIVAVTDARARQILQVCEHKGILVPDKISIIGVDDDEIARNLCRVSLSSVAQGCVNMGIQAAKLLHKTLDGLALKHKNILIPPLGIVERQSTDFKSLKDPFVMQAMHFIRQNASKGIKVDQVLDYVGISRSNLEQRFKEERGHTLHIEIHNAKLSKACKMLKNSDLPAAKIADICGYPSLQYMYAVFKKHFNKTPREFRNEGEITAIAV